MSSSQAEWVRFFTLSGIPDGIAIRYAQSFVANRVSKALIGELDRDTLTELGVTAVGDQMAILKRAKSAAAMETSISKPKRQPISAPAGDEDTRFTTLDERCASVQRKGKPPPDRHEIYHVKMPEGKTAKTRRILQHAERLRAAGLHQRGTSGVRQAGQTVRPVAEQHVSSTTDGGRFSSMHADRLSGVRTGRVVKLPAQQRVTGIPGLFSHAVAAASRPATAAGGVVRVQQRRQPAGGLPSVTVNLGGRLQRSTAAGTAGIVRRVAIGGAETQRSAAARTAGGARALSRRIQVVQDDMYEEEIEDDIVEEEDMVDEDGMEGEEEEDYVDEMYEDGAEVVEEEEEDDASTIVVGPSTKTYARTRIVPAISPAPIRSSAPIGNRLSNRIIGGGGGARRIPITQRLTTVSGGGGRRGAPSSVFERLSF